ncbi:MAG: hypothetical protein ACOCRK_11590 [bacterium]
MFSYKEIPFSNRWTYNLSDFFSWIKAEKQRLKPRGACAQSCSTLDGTVAFEKEYPTFEDAYEEWKKTME